MSDTPRGVSPDFGIRLAADAPNGQEATTYEVASLEKYTEGRRPLRNEWQSYSLDLRRFVAIAYSAAPSTNISRYTVNKIAFFLTTGNIVKCQKATLWFRDLRIEPPPAP